MRAEEADEVWGAGRVGRFVDGFGHVDKAVAVVEPGEGDVEEEGWVVLELLGVDEVGWSVCKSQKKEGERKEREEKEENTRRAE